MCNRYTASRHDQIRELALDYSGIKLSEDWKPYNNIPPTSRVPLVWRDKQPKAGLMQWGTQTPMGLVMNARAETLTQKPMWKPAVASRRCILLADGFFEFENLGRRKQAHYFTIKEKQVFGIAGIWLPASETQPARCVMVTTAPNPLVAPFHDRMPAILDDEPAKEWLGAVDLIPARIGELCHSFPEDRMNRWMAPPEANSVSYQEAAALKPYYPEPELF